MQKGGGPNTCTAMQIWDRRAPKRRVNRADDHGTLPRMVGAAAIAAFPGCEGAHVLFNNVEGRMPEKVSAPAPQSALSNFKNLPDDALARVGTVSMLFACSVPTVWRWAKAGKLPAPVRVGGVTGWQVGPLRKILAGAQ